MMNSLKNSGYKDNSRLAYFISRICKAAINNNIIAPNHKYSNLLVSKDTLDTINAIYGYSLNLDDVVCISNRLIENSEKRAYVLCFVSNEDDFNRFNEVIPIDLSLIERSYYSGNCYYPKYNCIVIPLFSKYLVFSDDSISDTVYMLSKIVSISYKLEVGKNKELLNNFIDTIFKLCILVSSIPYDIRKFYSSSVYYHCIDYYMKNMNICKRGKMTDIFDNCIWPYLENFEPTAPSNFELSNILSDLKLYKYYDK